jgi:site-specific recombinase XerD
VSQCKTFVSASRADVMAYLADLKKQGIGDCSASPKLTSVRGFYQWLMLTKGLVDHNPTLDITIQMTWQSQPKAISEGKVAKMLQLKPYPAEDERARAVHLRDSTVLECFMQAGRGLPKSRLWTSMMSTSKFPESESLATVPKIVTSRSYPLRRKR